MARTREPLPRLNLNSPMHMPQPGINLQGQPMFSPAIQAFHPSFPMPNSLQTPMQSAFFNPQPPPAPGRPTHHQGRASIAHLAAAGIHPPTGFPMTPLGGHFPRGSMMGIPGQPSAHPFPNRNRRQLSIGGPPKAVLGGPARKLSPLPVAAPSPAPAPQKVKKVNVNLPKETVPAEEEGQPPTRQPWARMVLDGFEFKDKEIAPVELTTAESYPPDEWRNQVPNTLDVFLPGKRAWEEMKQKAIEEKLEKLGVERGSGSNVPHIHAPHARAASISSPADPQILLYKLNKLQQAQDGTGSANNSLSASPNPPFGVLSSSPHRPSPRFLTNRHGHTMSLAHPPPQPFFDGGSSSFDPFGFNIELDVEPIPHSGPNALQDSIHTPQNHIPVAVSSLAPPQASRPSSRPDFIRGFGLDIPEEEEEEALNFEEQPPQDDMDQEQAFEHERESVYNGDGMATASQSRFHSRHVSRLSAALSTRSAGALDEEEFVGEEDLAPPRNVVPTQGSGQDDMDLEDVVGEWTGSEDVYLDETSDGEQSIGEWSNPSDEERERKQRLDRRNRRRASQQIDMPRRLPNFPRPPESMIAIPMRIEDDLISNPSEEGQNNLTHGDYLGIDYYSRPPSNLSGSSRPLPPLPHSRVASAQHTVYDPAHAHSRAASDQFVYPNIQSQPQSAQPSFAPAPAPAPRRESLNPFAKPFVFGAGRDSGSWGQISVGQGSSMDMTPPKAPLLSHSRLPSFGKPLNVAAPEFKPGGFTFRPPPGVPAMPPAPPAESRPLPEVPVEESPFKVQGREKRQRRGSSASVVEEGDSMTSFRFPANLESPQSIRRAPATRTHKLNPSAEPFTFAGFSAVANLPYVPRESDNAPEPAPEAVGASFEEALNDESTAKAENGEAQVENFNLPSSTKPKRAPIPLDFKHPVSSNTVPAGLFKALVNNGEDRTRRTVRSRLSSREIFEHTHRPSMDDSNVAPIAHKVNRSRSRLVTDPGFRENSSSDDVFGSTASHFRRRSSFTDVIRPVGHLASSDGHPESANSEMSLTGRLEMQQSERRIEALLEEGLGAIMRDLKRESEEQHSSTQAMISEILSLFRTQLRDSAARSLEASQLDARGEFDFQLFKDVVEESNKDLMENLRNDLNELQQQVWQARSTNDGSVEIVPAVERLGNRTISAVIEAISELSARQEAISRSAPARERDAIVDHLMAILTPVIGSMRPEPIDYEFLTSELTQAVKPHISQLIDLASDKQETAGLIVDRLIPLLPSSNIDIDTITHQLTTEVRRAIAPIDAFEIKEQVADLVVERLDSRLAVRDKAFNIESLSGKVTDGVSRQLEPLQGISASVEQLTAGQTALASSQEQLSSGQERIASLVSELPAKLADELQGLKSTQTEILVKLAQPTTTVSGPDEDVLSIKATVEGISAGQASIGAQAEDLRSLHQTILERLETLPETLQTVTDALQNNHAEFLSSHESSQRELDELRKSNTDYQIQLTKARGAHGQVRVEKDVLNEKLGAMENDRERLRNQVKELQASSEDKAAQASTLEDKNKELEDALAKALARLHASDVATQTNQARIAELENSNRELTSEKHALKIKVDSLDLQVTFASRDKESAVQALETLRTQHDQLASQQSHWDELHRASEKIELLTTLFGQADNEELKELRRYRDRTKVLEGEHAALQKRFKDQETKMGNSERAALTARQSLAQAQQRSSEWERRAKEFEGKLELTQTNLDQAEQTQAQLDADYSLAKLQLEEREANDRLTQDQQNKLREQISLLEAKVTRLQHELQQTKTSKVPPQPYRNITNGNAHPLPRPDSRASTIYDNRASTPQRRLQSHASTARSNTPPQASVWDSMHAPTTDAYKYATPTPTSSIHAPRSRYPNLGPTTPKARRPQQSYRPVAPSPTPSTVSLTPTQGDDGWWS
ncbi:hypothetical protein D9615_006437 [Tricholomella constricta]|uniref:Uncharacterized protein n=1 Tax=Tricholomella constricta TaxID=117010 RepID=A0A8H5M1H5_9AGAR|nr:hypothetical protein D9615_006437 [Tricholomella constricta]